MIRDAKKSGRFTQESCIKLHRGLKSFIEYFTILRNMHYDLPDTVELKPLNIVNPQEGGRKREKLEEEKV